MTNTTSPASRTQDLDRETVPRGHPLGEHFHHSVVAVEVAHVRLVRARCDDDVRGEAFEHRGKIAAKVCVEASLHDLHVLLRHRPSSIPQALIDALEARGVGLKPKVPGTPAYIGKPLKYPESSGEPGVEMLTGPAE
jgi:hypothetical protein